MIHRRALGAIGAVGPALWLLAAMAFIAQVGIAVMLPLLPLFATELGATPFMLGLLTSSFAITNAVGQLGAGILSDRFESRRFITGGLALYAGMNALIATAASSAWLLAWRALSGFGGGSLIVAQRIYIADVTEPSRRAFANGIVSAAASAGMVAGPAVGGLMAAIGGLRAPFVLVAVTSLIALVAAVALPRPARHARRDGAEGHAPQAPLALAPLAVLMVANTFVMAGYGGFITTYAPLATEQLAWTTLDIGIAFSFFGAGSIVLGPMLSHLADRVGRRGVAALAVLPLAAFGAALVVDLPQLAVLAVAFVSGGGLTAFSSAWYALLADASDERRRGRVFGVVSAVSNGGIVVGAMLAAQLWERVDLAAAMLSSSAMMLLAGVTLLAVRSAR